MLAVVVIAVGLVFITQGISVSLNSVRRLRAVQQQVIVAESMLNRLEAEAQQWGVNAPREEPAEPPDEAYRWRLTVEPVSDDTTFFGPIVAATLTVRPAAAESGASVLEAVWPAGWLQ